MDSTAKGAAHLSDPAYLRAMAEVTRWLAEVSEFWYPKPPGADKTKTHEDVIERNSISITKTLSGYSPNTCLRLNDGLTAREQSLLADAIFNHKETEEVINDFLSFSELMFSTQAIGAPGKRNLYVRGIGHYEGIEPQGSGTYPQRRLEQGTAILRITDYLRAKGVKNEAVDPDSGVRYARIKDETMRLLLTASEDPMALADLIIAREFTTGSEVEGFLRVTSDLAVPLRIGSL